MQTYTVPTMPAAYRVTLRARPHYTAAQLLAVVTLAMHRPGAPSKLAFAKGAYRAALRAMPRQASRTYPPRYVRHALRGSGLCFNACRGWPACSPHGLAAVLCLG